MSSKLTELTALSSASSDDIFYVVDDPAGVAVSRKITFANLLGIGAPIPSGTANSVLYLDSGGLLAQNNPGLTYDGTIFTVAIENGATTTQRFFNVQNKTVADGNVSSFTLGGHSSYGGGTEDVMAFFRATVLDWTYTQIASKLEIGVAHAGNSGLGVTGQIVLSGLTSGTPTLGIAADTTITGILQGTTLTDGTTIITGGNYTGVGNITGTDIDLSLGTGDITTTGTGTFQSLTLVMTAAQTKAIDINGIDTTYTGTGASFESTLNVGRKLDSGSGNDASNYYGANIEVTPQYTQADILGSREIYALHGRITAPSGRIWRNTTASNYNVRLGAIRGFVNDDNTYSSTSTGKISQIIYGDRLDLDLDQTFTATGGASNTSDAYGLAVLVNNNPTLSSGVLTVTNRALQLDVIGTAVGSSTNYCLLLNQCSGADTNWGVYDQTGADWAIVSNSTKIYLGAAFDSYIEFDGNSLNIVANAVTGTDNLDITANLAQFNATPITTTGKIIGAEVEINGNLNHDGSNIGFFGTAPATQAAAYTPSNVSADRSYNANATTIDELSDVLGTLINDLISYGLLQ